MPAVSLHSANLLSKNNVQFNVLANEPPQHFIHAIYDFIQVENLRLHGLFAAEDEKLSRQHGCALRSLPDFLDIILRRAVGTKLRRHEIAISDDDAQDIVEIVRHTSGKLANHLHFLDFNQLLFQPLMLVTFFDFLQGMADRRPQPANPVFQQIIRRALLHGYHRRFLANGARYDDERDFQSALLQQGQCAQPAKLRHRIIRENQVQAGTQVGEIVRFRFHPKPVGVKSSTV